MTYLGLIFTGFNWVKFPIDSGTYEVVSDGMKILYDPKELLTNLQKVVNRKANTEQINEH